MVRWLYFIGPSMKVNGTHLRESRAYFLICAILSLPYSNYIAEDSVLSMKASLTPKK